LRISLEHFPQSYLVSQAVHFCSRRPPASVLSSVAAFHRYLSVRKLLPYIHSFVDIPPECRFLAIYSVLPMCFTPRNTKPFRVRIRISPHFSPWKGAVRCYPLLCETFPPQSFIYGGGIAALCPYHRKMTLLPQSPSYTFHKGPPHIVSYLSSRGVFLLLTTPVLPLGPASLQLCLSVSLNYWNRRLSQYAPPCTPPPSFTRCRLDVEDLLVYCALQVPPLSSSPSMLHSSLAPFSMNIFSPRFHQEKDLRLPSLGLQLFLVFPPGPPLAIFFLKSLFSSDNFRLRCDDVHFICCASNIRI